MNKEEILKRSRAEHKDQDLVEEKVNAESGWTAYAAGALLCMILMLARRIITDEVELSCAIVYLGMFSARMFSKYHLKREKKYLLYAVLMSGITLVGLVVHIINLMG